MQFAVTKRLYGAEPDQNQNLSCVGDAASTRCFFGRWIAQSSNLGGA